MLRLVGETSVKRTCSRCQGKGKIPCPPTYAGRTGVQGDNTNGAILQRGTGHPIPCPACLGKKVVNG